jgi:antitoxin component HigA of HigAB toxin-antitoxin module
VPSFSFFRRRESDEVIASEQPPITYTNEHPSSLSIQQAQDLLQNIEIAKVKEVSIRLGLVKESASKSLKTIRDLADQLGQEKIKLEDLEQRYKSVVENSRKTVVSSLKRETSIEFPLPQTVNDTKKFKERFETMMNRISEVTGSHSKVLNVFMKKYAGKLKSEFEALSKLLNEVKSALSCLEEARAPIIKCNNILNTVQQKISSTKSIQLSIQCLEGEIKDAESEIQQLKEQMHALKNSSEYDQAIEIVQKIEEIEKQEEQLRLQISDLFLHVSRAFTKYSYNITKETEKRLYILSEEPWKIVEEELDISPYSLLLNEIRNSLEGGRIQLKDSDKTISYIDVILKSLPELTHKARTLKKEKELLLQGNSKLVHKTKEIDWKIVNHEEELMRKRQILEEQKHQFAEKTTEIENMLKEASKIISDVVGREQHIQYLHS